MWTVCVRERGETGRSAGVRGAVPGGGGLNRVCSGDGKVGRAWEPSMPF